MPLPRLLRSLQTPPAALLRSQCVLCEGGKGGEGGGEPLNEGRGDLRLKVGHLTQVSDWFRKG
jgi:hypothetical protein